VDVRIISATNRDLETMAREGDFREDLYYRLNVIPITVPPLRERADDIPILVTHFIGRHARKMGRVEPRVSRDVLERIQAFPWPGNVRELENAMERAVALCRGDSLELDDLPRSIRDFAPSEALGNGSGSPSGELPATGLNLEDYIAGLETTLIEQALKRAKYSQKRAAQLLGLTPRSLRYRLQKYNLDS
jgi:DNA-binding NtrC family response regulator